MRRWWIGRGRTAVLVFLILAAAAPGAPALDLNGFLRGKGTGDVAVSATFERYDEFWAGETKTSNPGLGTVETRSLSLWLAYGLTDELTLFANLPWVDSEGDGSAGFAESDLQDATLLVAYRFARLGGAVQSDFVGAVGLRTPASNYEADLPVSVGDGTTDGLIRFVYQLRRGGFYVSQQLGYDVRGGDAPDGVPLFTEAGYTRGRATYSGFFGKLVARDGTDIGDPGFTFPSNREEYDRIGAKVFVRLGGRLGIALAGWDTLSGRNTGDSRGVSLGLDIGF
jgi:hypothetical protein